jgi:hypothetical protein
MKIRRALGLAVFLLSVSAEHGFAECVQSKAESALWSAVANSSDPEEIYLFLNKFPDACFRDLAKLRVDKLVPEIPVIQVSGTIADSLAQTVGNGEWLDSDVNGGRNGIISLSLNVPPEMSSKLGFLLSCEPAGVGWVGWFPSGKECPDRSTPFLQGFEAKLTGPYAKYYDLSVDCYTMMYHAAYRPHRGPTAGWCGVSAADGEGLGWLKKALVSLKRKPL